jgi:tetratricopeptide (TPR) repeat protein
MGGPRTQDRTSITAAEVDVTEEVNKETKMSRVVLQSGRWDWKGHDTILGSLSAHGGFGKSPLVSHWLDKKTQQTMVSFSVTPLDPPNVDELQKTQWWGANTLGTLECSAEYDPNYFVFRERRGGSGGLAGGESGNSTSELIITRSVQKLEAEIIYDTDEFCFHWLPTMNGAASFQVRMVQPPDLPAQWKVSLYKTSNFPGVCNNADIDDFPNLAAEWQNRIKKDSYDLIFDFRHYGKTDLNFKPVEYPWQILETSKPVTGFGFAVNCLDYGAQGRLMAVAHVNGQPVAALRFGQPFVQIPCSPDCNDDHCIAYAATDLPDLMISYKGNPKDDKDNGFQPVRSPGDGLTLFEEYRGFFVCDGFEPFAPMVHRRLNPDGLDLFVAMDTDSGLSLSRFLADFQEAGPLHVWRVNKDAGKFVDAKRVINFNRGDIGTEQHALEVTDRWIDEDGVLGRAKGRGPPKNVESIVIDSRKINRLLQHRPGNFGDLLKMVTVHELGHGAGIRHHGDFDQFFNPDYGYVAVEGSQHSGDMACPMRYVGANWYVHIHGERSEYHRYDNKRELLGLKFCLDRKGTGLNERKAADDDSYYCGDADFGNCYSQIVINDNYQGGSAIDEEDRAAGGADQSPRQADDDAEKSARRSQTQAHVSVKLSLGDGATRAVIPGEAVVFNLSLAGLSGASLEVGKAGEAWTRQVSFKMLDANKRLVPLPVSVRPAGKPMQLDPGASKEMKPAAEQIKIVPETLQRAAFAIDASETAKLPAGELRIFAELNGKSLVSSSVAVTLRKAEEATADEQARAESIRLLSRAKLAYAEEKFFDAEQLARKIIASEPKSFQAYLILARSLEQQKKLREAYDAYRKALEYRPPPRDPKTAEPPLEIIFALDDLRDKLGIQLQPPPATGQFFLEHSLFAISGNGKLNSPFPTNPRQLVFEWQRPKAGNDVLGIRWIAVDTRGAAPPNHLIATSKSDSGKAEGRFTLKSPTAGFPPGQYRVEIWQTGKMIYSEKFEIKRD